MQDCEVQVDEINERIRAKQIRLVSDDGSEVISKNEALKRANEVGLDLVLVAANVVPPVCKLMDYGKFKFEQSKKERQERAKARQSEIHVREIQMRPVTDVNDIRIKAKKTSEFLSDGDKVKIKVKFRGREVAYLDMGREVITSLLSQVTYPYDFEQEIVLNGKDMTAILKPTKK